uniref:Ovule protein n=1 Tax=Heterorhabditis bacteriophora TaxID=37862 RepID=A0A1I7WXU4_HETBA
MSELDLIMLTYTSEEANDMLEEHYHSGMRNSHQSARDYFYITGRFYRVPPVPSHIMQRFPSNLKIIVWFH